MIEERLQQDEGKILEFKRDLSSPRGVLKTLVAFANSAGGCVVLGVTDDKQVVGVVDPLSEEERICNLIADSICPRLVPTVELITVEGKTLLVIETFPSSARPHYLKAMGPEKGVFVRLGSTNRQAGVELIAVMHRNAQGIVFDEIPMPQLDKNALDLELAQKLFASKRVLTDEVLQTLKILKSEQGRLVPTHGAMLLFGRERERYFPDAWVQCGRFRGKDKVYIFDQAEIYQPLPIALTEIELFLQKHAFKSARFGALQREDIWSIPLTILREVLVNALVHTDYSQRGTPIRVAFFDNRIDVENPGFLMPGMTIDDMKSGVSRIRNPVIARIFRELNLIEQWGSGVKRIFAEAREQDLPEPIISEIATGLRFTVWLSEEQDMYAEKRVAERETNPVSKQVKDRAPNKDLTISVRVRELIAVIGDQSLTSRDIMSLLGLRSKPGFLRNYLSPAVTEGFVAMTQPDSPRSPTQKYLLTAEGDALLARLKGGNKTKSIAKAKRH